MKNSEKEMFMAAVNAYYALPGNLCGGSCHIMEALLKLPLEERPKVLPGGFDG